MKFEFGQVYRFDYGSDVGLITIMLIEDDWCLTLLDEDRVDGRRYETGTIENWDWLDEAELVSEAE